MTFARNGRIERLIVHHSASPHGTTVADIDAWHRERGFEGIGYHYVIGTMGIVHRCRPVSAQGAHCRKFNHGSIGICLIGDNSTPGQGWKEEQIISLRVIWAACQLLFEGITIHGHRDLVGNSTLCPGASIDQHTILGDSLHADP